MYIIGNAEEAEELAQGCLVKMKEIYEATKTLQTDMRRLEEGWQDEGIVEIRDVINQVIKEIDSHLDDIVELSNLMKAYAEILCRR